MGCDLAMISEPINGRVLWFRVETPKECWTVSDKINSSWSTLHSPFVNEKEASC